MMNLTLLIFEGEYSNRLRNGKGKEIYEGKLEFEGEYKDGKKWNGKIYDYGNNIYELKNGKGLVKEFEGGYLSFEGEYLNGKRNGKG